MKIACYIRNPAVYDNVKDILSRTGYECTHFTSEATLLRLIKRSDFGMILIDLGSEAREEDSGILSWLTLRTGDRTPVFALSPIRNAEFTAMVLNSGAEDFLLRPFEAVELTARINAVMRRCAPPVTRRAIELAGFTLDRESGKFSYENQPITLTPREFSMAWLFFSSPGIYISRETIGTVIWSADSEVAGRTIEQHVYKLRKKLQVAEKPVVIIRTAYTHGYRLELAGE